MDYSSEEHFYVWVEDHYRTCLVVPDNIDGKVYFNIYCGDFDIGILEKNKNGIWVWESSQLEFDAEAHRMGAAIEEYYKGLEAPRFIPPKRGYWKLWL